MLKRILLSLALFGASAAALAQQNGFYLGANLDYLWITFDHEIQLRSNPGPFEAAIDHENGLTSGFMAGYKWFLPRRYTLGLEALADYDDVSHIKYGRRTDTKKILYTDIGLQLQPGYLLTPKTNLYAIVGASLGYFGYKAYPENAPLRQSHYVEPGYTLGLGVGRWITPHLALRLNYEYTRFASHHDISGPGGRYLRNGFAKTDEVALGLLYSF